MSKPFLDIQDMFVADFRVPSLDDTTKEWRDKTNIFMAESCARQIWVGSTDDLSSFPREAVSKTAKNFTLLTGAEAYSLLLKLNLGLLSKIEGETNITGQFQMAWRTFKEGEPEKARPFEKIVQHITGDSRLIRHHVLDGWKLRNRELCARDLSDMRQSDSVLIIGHKSPNGAISSATDNLARKVASNPARSASEICITNPDPDVTASLLRDMNLARDNGYVPTKISAIDFYADLPSAFESFDRVYCTIPMDAEPEADAFMIDCWAQRNEGNNTFAHLLGMQEKGTPISEQWRLAKLDNFISPRDIDKEMDARGEKNKTLLKYADAAIAHCTALRLDCKQASAKTLRDDGVPSVKPALQEARPIPSPRCG